MTARARKMRLEILQDLHQHLVKIADRKRREGKRLIGEHAALKKVATQILTIEVEGTKNGKRKRV